MKDDARLRRAVVLFAPPVFIFSKGFFSILFIVFLHGDGEVEDLHHIVSL
jgi:hypothetical protein